MYGMRSANNRGRKMSVTRPLSAPSRSVSSVTGHRPALATKIADSATALARARPVQRPGRQAAQENIEDAGRHHRKPGGMHHLDRDDQGHRLVTPAPPESVSACHWWRPTWGIA